MTYVTGRAVLGTDRIKIAPTTMLSYSPHAVTYMKGFIHRGYTRCISGHLQLAARYKTQGYKALEQLVRHLYRQSSHST